MPSRFSDFNSCFALLTFPLLDYVRPGLEVEGIRANLSKLRHILHVNIGVGTCYRLRRSIRKKYRKAIVAAIHNLNRSSLII